MASLQKKISIMVPALNEAQNVAKAINAIQEGLQGLVEDYELLVFNDGSTDQTGKIVDDLARLNPHIKVTHHATPRGLGACFREGLEAASFDYYMYIPGDNEVPSPSITAMVRHLGEAEILVHYVTNMHVRPLSRQLVSHVFTFALNGMFDLRMPYFNGMNVYPTALLKQLPLNSNGHAYAADTLIRLVKKGATFALVPCEMMERQAGNTTAFKLKNVASVFSTIARLTWDLRRG